MSTSTTERAREVAGTAAEEGQHVTETAKQEAAHVAGEAKEQAQRVLEQALSQVNEQTAQQRDRLVDTLSSLSKDLQSMASQSGASGLAADVTREIADRCRGLSTRIEGREPQEILDDIRSFARQRPGTFLLGALAAGVVAGRVARGAKAAASSGSGSEASSPATPSNSTSVTPTVASTPMSGSAQVAAGAPDPMASPSTPGQRTQSDASGSTP